ncbi:MAG: hypothetical protein WD231_03765 [Candidatus Woykebacteria bacterium]
MGTTPENEPQLSPLKEGGEKISLGSEHTRRMRALLLEEHDTQLDICFSLWPLAGRGQASRQMLRERLKVTRARALPIIQIVWEHPELEAELPEAEQVFYKDLRERFGSFEKVRQRAYRWRAGNPRSGTFQANQPSPTIDLSPQEGLDQRRSKVPLTLQSVGLPSTNHVLAHLLKAALLYGERNRYRLAAKFAESIQNISRHFSEVLEMYQRACELPKEEWDEVLGPEVASACREIKARWEDASLEDIIRSGPTTSSPIIDPETLKVCHDRPKEG